MELQKMALLILRKHTQNAHATAINGKLNNDYASWSRFMCDNVHRMSVKDRHSTHTHGHTGTQAIIRNIHWYETEDVRSIWIVNYNRATNTCTELNARITHDVLGWKSGNRIIAIQIICLFIIYDLWVSWTKIFDCFGLRWRFVLQRRQRVCLVFAVSVRGLSVYCNHFGSI